jgi:hypothetical protein
VSLDSGALAMRLDFVGSRTRAVFHYLLESVILVSITRYLTSRPYHARKLFKTVQEKLDLLVTHGSSTQSILNFGEKNSLTQGLIL